MYKFNARFVLC